MRHETPVEVLKRILGNWARRGEDLHAARERLGDDVLAAFKDGDLANLPRTAFTEVSRALVVGRQAKVVVADPADLESPNLAVLILCDDGRWRLESLSFQCASCFGSGVLGLEPCDVCGATGWGLVESNWAESSTVQ